MPTRPPNAMKHGAFAHTSVLRGESIEEFDALCTRLAAHLEPEGDLEGATVLAIARCLWRKQRLHKLAKPDVAPDGSAAAEAPTLEVVVEAFEIEGKLETMITRHLGRLQRLQRRREAGGIMGFPKYLRPLPPEAQIPDAPESSPNKSAE